MIVFADASAIAKLLVSEIESEQVAAEQGPFGISALTRVEVASAIWMKARLGVLDPSRCSLLVSSWLNQLTEGRLASGADVFEIAIIPTVLTDATRLCGIHGLRAGDAIQLATAIAARRVEPSCGRFLVFDRRLAEAAAREGFAVVGPEPG